MLENKDAVVEIVNDTTDNTFSPKVNILINFDDPVIRRNALIGLAKLVEQSEKIDTNVPIKDNIRASYIVRVDGEDDTDVTIIPRDDTEQKIPTELLAGIILIAFVRDRVRQYGYREFYTQHPEEMNVGKERVVK